MPMPMPNLDDRRWDDLVDEGRALIPVYSRDWTDHNVSDPGITFLELFAWITELPTSTGTSSTMPPDVARTIVVAALRTRSLEPVRTMSSALRVATSSSRVRWRVTSARSSSERATVPSRPPVKRVPSAPPIALPSEEPTSEEPPAAIAWEPPPRKATTVPPIAEPVGDYACGWIVSERDGSPAYTHDGSAGTFHLTALISPAQGFAEGRAGNAKLLAQLHFA